MIARLVNMMKKMEIFRKREVGLLTYEMLEELKATIDTVVPYMVNELKFYDIGWGILCAVWILLHG